MFRQERGGRQPRVSDSNNGPILTGNKGEIY